MTTKEAFQELLDSKVIPTNLRSQWSYRFERDKLSIEKIQEALLEHGYNIRIPAKWKSPDDGYVRSTCESFAQLLLTSKIPSNRKKIWKNRMNNCLLSINKIEETLLKYKYKKVQPTLWDNYTEYDEKKRLSIPENVILAENEEDAVWLKGGIYYNLLKGEAYLDNEKKAKNRELLYDQLYDGERHPLIVDTSNLVEQTKEAQAYYAHIDRREKFYCLAIIANSRESIYYSNFFKEINGPQIPTKVFHDIEEAEAWCKDFIITPPKEAIKMENSVLWLKDNIIHAKYFSKYYDLKSAKKEQQQSENSRPTEKMPMIVDYRSMEKMEKKLKEYYRKHPYTLEGFSCFAAITDHPMNDAIVQFFAEHPEFNVPTRHFRRYSEALHWVKSLKKD